MDPNTFLTIAAGILGLLVGSFLNVVIWRVPRGESVVAPRSQCPVCAAQLRAIDNVPVISWLVLRARCHHCGAHISLRYPLVELGCGALFAAVGAEYAESWAMPAYLVFAGALLALSVIDIEHYRLPNRIVYPLSIVLPVLVGVAAIADHDLGGWGRALAAGAAAFTGMLVLHLISPKGMGLGDVKLAFSLGVALGWLGWVELMLGLVLGFLYGAVIGVFLIATKLRGRRDPVPFGPFLAAGAMTMVLWGAPIVDWYTGRG